MTKATPLSQRANPEVPATVTGQEHPRSPLKTLKTLKTPTSLDTPPTKKKPASSPLAELNLDLLPDLIGYQLRLTQLSVFDDFAADLKEYDISPGRFGVLVLISANPGITQSRLAAAAQLDRSTMVAVIDQLEARQLVERRASPTDRRSNALVLTPPGEALLKQLKNRIKAHESRIAAAMTPDETQTFVALLTRVREALKENSREA